jgi:ribonuclease HII
VGRASLAGPIMAAGVLFDLERIIASGAAGREFLKKLNDSKQLSPAKREWLAAGVFVYAEVVSLVSIPAGQIDRIKIDAANRSCLERALCGVGERAGLRLVDGDGRRPLSDEAPEHEWIPQGDAKSVTIAAASIVAKVACDRVMVSLGKLHPGYGFERHMGYGTPEHLAALAELGPISDQHRQSFDVQGLGETATASQSRSPRRASLRALPAAELATYLLETPTIGDRLWTHEPRLPRETRTAFIRRVLLDEHPPPRHADGGGR